jgi:hypothetical protein
VQATIRVRRDEGFAAFAILIAASASAPASQSAHQVLEDQPSFGAVSAGREPRRGCSPSAGEISDKILERPILTQRIEPRVAFVPDRTGDAAVGPFPRDIAIERLLDGGVLRVQRVGADGELEDIAVWENRPR